VPPPPYRGVRMDEDRILYAIAESCPFDALLIADMKRSVNSLLQLNLKRFRVPQKVGTTYSALDVMKQALELLYEYSPSERNYREAMRTIQVYSENDEEMLHTLQASFSLIANAVYSAFSGQRHAESLAPEILFLQGIPFKPSDLQQPFRFVGVKPPDMSPPSVRDTVFLDAGFEPYKLLLDGKLGAREAQHGREEHWAGIIESKLSGASGTALIRAGAEHIDKPRSIARKLEHRMKPSEMGRLPAILSRKGIQIKVVHRTPDVNQAFRKT
jgi:hypothetical protein